MGEWEFEREKCFIPVSIHFSKPGAKASIIRVLYIRTCTLFVYDAIIIEYSLTHAAYIRTYVRTYICTYVCSIYSITGIL